MRLSLNKVILLFLVLSLACGKTAKAENEVENQYLSRLISSEADRQISEKEPMTSVLTKTIEEQTDAYIRAMYRLEKMKKDEAKELPAFHYFITGVATHAPYSEFLLRQLYIDMNDSVLKAASGNLTTPNSGIKDKRNPYSAILARSEADWKELLDTEFCIPESKNASEDCAKDKSKLRPYGDYENFVDFYVNDRPWKDMGIRNVFMLARRFLGGAVDRPFVIKNANDSGSFMRHQTAIARENMRAAVMNDLAARRAPTNMATGDAMALLLRVLAPTQQIDSMNYNTICADKKRMEKFPAIKYACSRTTKSGNYTLISRSSIDRIFQFDFVMSPEFFDVVNSSSIDGQLDKELVYLKSQQLAQDYRALRMLQMKTALTAMNMMNSGK